MKHYAEINGTEILHEIYWKLTKSRPIKIGETIHKGISFLELMCCCGQTAQPTDTIRFTDTVDLQLCKHCVDIEYQARFDRAHSNHVTHSCAECKMKTCNLHSNTSASFPDACPLENVVTS